jgi:hypothetical protein
MSAFLCSAIGLCKAKLARSFYNLFSFLLEPAQMKATQRYLSFPALFDFAPRSSQKDPAW